MTSADLEIALRARDCTIVSDGSKFALVYPAGYEQRHRSHELHAASREQALGEAWVWLHPANASADWINRVVAVVAADFGTTPAAMIARDRTEPLATARRVAMALAREVTGATFQAIAGCFADRDHGTVMNAQRSVMNQCATEPAFAARVGTLRAACNSSLLGSVEGAA